MLLIYLLGVFLVAVRHGRAASVLASLLSAAAFAYFFAPPIFSLAIASTEELIGLTVMLLVANITSNLVERIRLQADLAAQRERRAAALYRLSEALSEARSGEEVVTTAVRHLRTELGVSTVILLAGAAGAVAYPCCRPLPESLRGADLDPARRVSERHTAEESRAGVVYLSLETSGRILGVLVLAPESRLRRADPEETTFIDTLRHQIAQSLERVRLREQASAVSLQAEAEALRNSLLSAISHDLRTPLTRIVGTASTLAEQNAVLTAAEREEFAAAIQGEAQHMADLMSKILDMARITTGKIALQREWNAVEEIVGATLTRLDNLLSRRPVSIHLPSDLPLVRLDAVLLQQVLMNLLENAVKYTPEGSPIDISADWSPPTLRLVVADRGPGIPDALNGRLFEKFQRLASESAQSGVGLGLALCRAIVEAHGGEIGVRDRAGGGAEFFLTLPVPDTPPALTWQETPETES